MTFRLYIILLTLLLSGIVTGQNVEFDKNNFRKKKKEFKSAIAELQKGDKYFEDGVFLNALKYYLKANEFNPDNARLNLKIGKCYLRSATKDSSLEYLEKAYSLEPRVDKEIHYMLGLAYHHSYNFDKSLEYYQKSIKDLPGIHSTKRSINRAGLNMKIENVKTAKDLIKNPHKVTIQNIHEINSPFPDYAPLITADESMMVFTSRRNNSTGRKLDDDGLYFEDVYVSYKKRGNWEAPINIGPPINSNNHDAAVYLSNDGQKLFIYKGQTGGGDIYVSELIGDSWSNPEPLGRNINSPYHESQVSLAPDGRILYFVSERPRGFGGSDIYLSKWDIVKKDWGRAQNLGMTINTKHDERSVFIHPDGKTLYFSSNGHNSMGGYDVFSSTYDTGKWSEPENMGYPINTPDDDLYFIVSGNGKHAYYTSIRKEGYGEKDIYKIKFKKGFIKLRPLLTLLKGIVTDMKTSAPIDAIIHIIDNEKSKEKGVGKTYYGCYRFKRPSKKKPEGIKVNLLNYKGEVIDTTFTDEDGYFVFRNLPVQENFIVTAREDDPDLELLFYDEISNVIAEYKTNSKTGEFLIPLPSGKNYGIVIYSPGYLFHSDNIDIPDTATYKDISTKIHLQRVEQGSKIVLNNLFFESGKETLRPESVAELNRVVNIMNKYPTLIIEISGHTDSQGSDTFNQMLSEKRAKNVIEYLSERGISKDRLKHKGYGKTKPIASNDTEEGRKINRRIEFMIIEK